jgi:hypothetical protein
MLSAGAAAAAEVAEAVGAAVEAAEGAAAAAAAVAAACRGAVAPSAKFHAVTLAKRQPPRTAGAFSLNRPSATPSGRVAQSAERVREQHETVVRNHSPATNHNLPIRHLDSDDRESSETPPPHSFFIEQNGRRLRYLIQV